jgi:5'-nucleotidase
MRILLTNDDGPFGPGFHEVRLALSGMGDVTAICPSRERSGASHAITVLAPLHPSRFAAPDGAEIYTLSGTPADCVKFAMLELLDGRPDTVVSGPNLGINAGADVFYSGTVAAALEGSFYGVPAFALSTSRANVERMDAVADEALRVLDRLMRVNCGRPCAWNVNIPHLVDGRPELRFTRQSPVFPEGAFSHTVDTRGREHYWLDSTAGDDDHPADSDMAAVLSGCISATPLRNALTDTELLERLQAPIDERIGGSIL